MGDQNVPLSELLAAASIHLDASASSRDEAIRQAGAALIATGAVGADYVEAMLEREQSVSTYVGEGIAMPHGTLASKSAVLSDALVLLRFAEPVDWNGDPVRLVIGIAARGRGYIALVSRLASVLMLPNNAEALRTATSADRVYEILATETGSDS